ncbi:hypothetical protein Tco_1215125 [Tanacetum coccineum]
MRTAIEGYRAGGHGQGVKGEACFPPEVTKPVIPPPSYFPTDITNTGARITVQLQASISLPPEAEVERLLAMLHHQHHHLTPQFTKPSTGVALLASTQALIDAVTVALPSPPLPLLPMSLYIPPLVERKDDIPESERPPHKRLCLSTLGSRYEVGESSTTRPTRGRGIDYGFVSTVDAEARRQRYSESLRSEAVPKIAPITVGEVNTRVTELAELHEHVTQDLYALLEDAQDSRTRISHRVTMIDTAAQYELSAHSDACKSTESPIMHIRHSYSAGNSYTDTHTNKPAPVGNAEKKGNASRDPDSNVVTGMFLLNNRYASILFDIGADRSFISSAFSSLIDIAQTPLENIYDWKYTTGKYRGIFDVLIGMDWLKSVTPLSKCDEKLVFVNSLQNEA